MDEMTSDTPVRKPRAVSAAASDDDAADELSRTDRESSPSVQPRASINPEQRPEMSLPERKRPSPKAKKSGARKVRAVAPAPRARSGNRRPPQSPAANQTEHRSRISVFNGFLPGVSRILRARLVLALSERIARWRSSLAHLISSRTAATVTAAAILVSLVVGAGVVRGEIDLAKLAGLSHETLLPRIVVTGGKVVNVGDGPAANVEITRPRYKLIGTLEPGAGIEIPAPDFAIQYEWLEDGKTRRATRAFKVGAQDGAPNNSNDNRVAGRSDHGTGRAAENTALSTDAPDGLTARYDPATHLLTVSAAQPMEIRVDGFLLRPVSRTAKDGTEYRYVQANILVLGQDLKEGDTVTFEVVFTRPQDFYSIPIYARVPGREPVYFVVSVSAAGEAP